MTRSHGEVQPMQDGARGSGGERGRARGSPLPPGPTPQTRQNCSAPGRTAPRTPNSASPGSSRPEPSSGPSATDPPARLGSSWTLDRMGTSQPASRTGPSVGSDPARKGPPSRWRVTLEPDGSARVRVTGPDARPGAARMRRGTAPCLDRWIAPGEETIPPPPSPDVASTRDRKRARWLGTWVGVWTEGRGATELRIDHIDKRGVVHGRSTSPTTGTPSTCSTPKASPSPG